MDTTARTTDPTKLGSGMARLKALLAEAQGCRGHDEVLAKPNNDMTISGSRRDSAVEMSKDCPPNESTGDRNMPLSQASDRQVAEQQDPPQQPDVSEKPDSTSASQHVERCTNPARGEAYYSAIRPSGVVEEHSSNLLQLQHPAIVSLLAIRDRLERARLYVDLLRTPTKIILSGTDYSNKTALIESLSGLSFFSKGVERGMAIEMVLTRSRASSVSVEVEMYPPEIMPGSEDVLKELTALQLSSSKELTRLYEQVSECMTRHHGPHSWPYILKIKFAGPDQPHLTLVDLPNTDNCEIDESSRKWSKAVARLTEHYCTQYKAVVIAARSEICPRNEPFHDVLDFSIRYPERTLKVLTSCVHPPASHSEGDTLKPGSSNSCAEETQALSHWHFTNINKDEDEFIAPACIAATELKHFNVNAWNAVDPGSKGLQALKDKIATSVLEATRPAIVKCMSKLEDRLFLGSRWLTDVHVMRQYNEHRRRELEDLALEANHIMESSLNATYLYDAHRHKAFFSQNANRFRDILNTMLTELGVEIRSSWRWCIHASSDMTTCFYCGSPSILEQAIAGEQSSDIAIDIFTDMKNPGTADSMQRISLERFCSDLERHHQASRGMAPAAQYTPKTLQDILRVQSANWTQICERFEERCRKVVSKFVRDILCHLTNDSLGVRLYSESTKQVLRQVYEDFHEKIQELLWPYLQAYPMGTDTRIHKEGMPWCPKVDLNQLSPELISGYMLLSQASNHAASAIDNILNNIATLAIERCLVGGLRRLFSIEAFARIDDITLRKLGGEASHRYPVRLTLGQISALHDAIDACFEHKQAMNAAQARKEPASVDVDRSKDAKRTLENQESATSSKAEAMRPDIVVDECPSSSTVGVMK